MEYECQYVYPLGIKSDRRQQTSRIGAQAAQVARLLAFQTQGKTLKVVQEWHGDKRTGSIRVAGDWLAAFGFHIGDTVRVQAANGQVTITKQVS